MKMGSREIERNAVRQSECSTAPEGPRHVAGGASPRNRMVSSLSRNPWGNTPRCFTQVEPLHAMTFHYLDAESVGHHSPGSAQRRSRGASPWVWVRKQGDDPVGVEQTLVEPLQGSSCLPKLPTQGALRDPGLWCRTASRFDGQDPMTRCVKQRGQSLPGYTPSPLRGCSTFRCLPAKPTLQPLCRPLH